MPLTARILQENGRDNIECYAAGTNGNLPVGIIPCAPNGRTLGLEWAIPCSTNGVTVTSFNYVMATDGTKPRADAIKVIVIEDVANGGSYKKAIVPDAYTISDWLAACCAGCDPIADVTAVEPFIFNGECTVAAPTLPGCVFKGSFYVPALTGGNTTFTATPLGYNADGGAITFAPGTSTGTTVALLAADMQTNWAAEMGVATFVATGNVIEWTATIAASFAVTIAQS